jgi:hypothetical protein
MTIQSFDIFIKSPSSPPTMTAIQGPTMPLFTALLLLVFLIESRAQCAEEFEKCVMNRDCCEGSSCVAGDWSVTTDSTCLSKRSEKLNALAMDEKLELVQEFYAKLPDSTNTPTKAKDLVEKYAGRREFAQLVARLKRKYDKSVGGPEKYEL